jgi:hypothetical protein
VVYYLCEKSEEMRVENYGAWSTGWQEKKKGREKKRERYFKYKARKTQVLEKWLRLVWLEGYSKY